MNDEAILRGAAGARKLAQETRFGKFAPMRSTLPGPHRVAILVYEGLQFFEFGIAVEAFARPRPAAASRYECTVVAADRATRKLLQGAAGVPTAGLEALASADTVVIPGWRDHREAPPASMVRALQAASGRGARFVSICLGAFVLAAAGLLDGRRATTHWAYARAFQRRFPQVRLEPDVLYVDEGDIITSAGSAAGIDTCLHLIRRDFGAQAANRVARAMVVPPHRDGGQAQYVEAPVTERPGRGIGPVLAWARERLHEPITVDAMAGRAAMSRRTLLRRFAEATGATPKAWLNRERLHRAQGLLETTDLPLERIAQDCGFASLETFRVAFRRTLRTTPAAYRRQFRHTPA